MTKSHNKWKAVATITKKYSDHAQKLKWINLDFARSDSKQI